MAITLDVRNNRTTSRRVDTYVRRFRVAHRLRIHFTSDVAGRETRINGSVGDSVAAI